MNPGYTAFDKLRKQDRLDYFAAAAERIDSFGTGPEHLKPIGASRIDHSP